MEWHGKDQGYSYAGRGRLGWGASSLPNRGGQPMRHRTATTLSVVTQQTASVPRGSPGPASQRPHARGQVVGSRLATPPRRYSASNVGSPGRRYSTSSVLDGMSLMRSAPMTPEALESSFDVMTVGVAAPARPARAWEKKVVEGRRKGNALTSPSLASAYASGSADRRGRGGNQPHGHGGPTFSDEDEADDSLEQFTCKTGGCPAMKIFVKSNGYCVQCNLSQKEAGGGRRGSTTKSTSGGTDNHLSEAALSGGAGAGADVVATAYDESRVQTARRTFSVPRGQYEKASFTTYGAIYTCVKLPTWSVL